MKRCPKCSRTFPDENQKFCTFDGGLLIAQPAFDPNATIRATTADFDLAKNDPPRPAKSTSRELPNIERGRQEFNRDETIAASAPTAFFPRSGSPGGNQTSANLPPPPPPAQNLGVITAPDAIPKPSAAPVKAAQKKRSKLPWILGALVVLLLLGGGGLAAVFFVVVKPRLEQMNQTGVQRETPPAANEETATGVAENTRPEETKATETPAEETFVPPADAKLFTNSKDNLDGKLAEQYVDFYFYYPGSWRTDPKAGVKGASNFARVFKTIEDQGGDYIPESVAISWYTSNGTYESDLSVFPSRVQSLSTQLAKDLPEYRKVSEGPTQINSLKAYEFHFTGVFNESDQADLPYWGRVIFIPPGVEGQKTGVSLMMIATSRAESISNVEDIGVKGEMPIILESFRLGRKP